MYRNMEYEIHNSQFSIYVYYVDMNGEEERRLLWMSNTLSVSVGGKRLSSRVRVGENLSDNMSTTINHWKE